MNNDNPTLEMSINYYGLHIKFIKIHYRNMYYYALDFIYHDLYINNKFN